MATDVPGSSRLSSLTSRLALLIAVLLILTALVTAIYSAISAHSAASAAAAQSMANAHRSTSLLISQSYSDEERFRNDSLAARRAELKDVAAPIVASLDELRAGVARGDMTEAAAKTEALEMLKSVRYRNKDYFFTYDSTGTAISHPDAKFQGKNLIGMTDPDGVHVVARLLEIGNVQGSGYLDYQWVRLGQNKPSPKIAYVFKYPAWNWYIGTGVYVDDIQAEAAARLESTKLALGKSFSQVKFGADGALFVLDKNGSVVVQPEGRDLSALSGSALAHDLVTAAPANDADINSVNRMASINGTEQMYSMDVSSFSALGWTLVSAVPQQSIDAPGNALAWRQALLSLGVLGLGLLIGLLASRRIVKPVTTMTKAAVDLGNDQFDPAMLDEAAARKDEVGTLAKAFQRMGTDIVERERKLREQVKKLTVVIDRQKVADEVGAIAESDYFKQLQERSGQIRDRDSKAPSD